MQKEYDFLKSLLDDISKMEIMFSPYWGQATKNHVAALTVKIDQRCYDIECSEPVITVK